MARIRTVKPEFWTSESIGRLSRDARLLFIALWNLADDSGRIRGSLPYLSGAAFPYDDDARGLIGGWLDQLERERMIRRYIGPDGNNYIDIPNWLKHQKIERPSPSKLPPFPESSPNPHRGIAEASVLDQGSGIREGEGRGNGTPHPPTGQDGQAQPAAGQPARPRLSAKQALVLTLKRLGLCATADAADEWAQLCAGRAACTSAAEGLEFIAWAVERGKQDGQAVAFAKHAAIYADAWAARRRSA